MEQVNAEKVGIKTVKGSFTLRDKFEFGFLAAIELAKEGASKEEGNFNDLLMIALQSDADLRTNVRRNPAIAKRTIGYLPCGRNVVMEFIKNLQQGR